MSYEIENEELLTAPSETKSLKILLGVGLTLAVVLLATLMNSFHGKWDASDGAGTGTTSVFPPVLKNNPATSVLPELPGDTLRGVDRAVRVSAATVERGADLGGHVIDLGQHVFDKTFGAPGATAPPPHHIGQ